MSDNPHAERAALIRRIKPTWKLPHRWTAAYLAQLAADQDQKAQQANKEIVDG